MSVEDTLSRVLFQEDLFNSSIRTVTVKESAFSVYLATPETVSNYSVAAGKTVVTVTSVKSSIANVAEIQVS